MTTAPDKAALGRALHEAICKAHPDDWEYIEEFDPRFGTVLDGTFDLKAVAAIFLAKIQGAGGAT